MLKLLTASDLIQQVQKLYATGMSRGEKTGWISLDQYYSVVPGYWTAVTGIPSHGKSTWMDNLMLNLAERGWQFVIYSPENQPHEVHVCALIEKFVGMPLGQCSPSQLNEAIAFVDENFRFMSLPEDAPGMASLDDVLSLADEAIEVFYSEKIGLVLDPWNELDHTRVGGMAETEYISYQLSKWRQYVRSRKIHGWIVAHPTKIQRLRAKDGSTGQFVVPSLYDINGSAHWFNKSDNGVVVWRDEEKPGTCEIHIKKVKFKHHGKAGVCILDYEPSTGIYKEPLGYAPRTYSAVRYNPQEN